LHHRCERESRPSLLDSKDTRAHGRPAFGPGGTRDFRKNALPPALQRLDQILRPEPLDDLRMRETIAEALALHVSSHRDRLEDDRGNVGSWDQQQDVALHRVPERRRPAGFEADDDEPEDELPEALAAHSVPQEQVQGAGDQERPGPEISKRQPARDGNHAVERRGIEALSSVRLGIRRDEASRKPRSHRVVHEHEQHGWRDKETEEGACGHGPVAPRKPTYPPRSNSAIRSPSLTSEACPSRYRIRQSGSLDSAPIFAALSAV